MFFGTSLRHVQGPGVTRPEETSFCAALANGYRLQVHSDVGNKNLVRYWRARYPEGGPAAHWPGWGWGWQRYGCFTPGVFVFRLRGWWRRLRAFRLRGCRRCGLSLSASFPFRWRMRVSFLRRGRSPSRASSWCGGFCSGRHRRWCSSYGRGNCRRRWRRDDMRCSAPVEFDVVSL